MKIGYPRLVIGLFFIILGILLLIPILFSWLHIDISFLWPIFIMFPGLILLAIYFQNKKKPASWVILIPGIIIVCISILFFVNSYITTLTGHSEVWALTVMVYPLSVAIAFYVSYMVSHRLVLLIIGKILGLISLFIGLITWTIWAISKFFPHVSIWELWPLCIIAIGVIVLMGPLFRWMIVSNINNNLKRDENIKDIEADIIEVIEEEEQKKK